MSHAILSLDPSRHILPIRSVKLYVPYGPRNRIEQVTRSSSNYIVHVRLQAPRLWIREGRPDPPCTVYANPAVQISIEAIKDIL